MLKGAHMNIFYLHSDFSINTYLIYEDFGWSLVCEWDKMTAHLSQFILSLNFFQLFVDFDKNLNT